MTKKEMFNTSLDMSFYQWLPSPFIYLETLTVLMLGWLAWPVVRAWRRTRR